MSPFHEYRVASKGQIDSYILPSSSEMQRLDAATISSDNLSADELMLRAGSGIAKLALKRFPNTKRALVFSGTGNNGGDGLVITKYLRTLGIHTELLVAPGNRYSDLFLAQLTGVGCFYLPQLNAEPLSKLSPLQGLADFKIIEQTELIDRIKRADLIFDALLGTGQSGAPRGVIAILVELISHHRSRSTKVVSVDIPTGINCDSGAVYSPHIAADATYSVQFIKRGLMQFPARSECGVLEAVDIGIAGTVKEVEFSLINSETAPSKPVREADIHKGRLGRVLVIGGSLAMPGAAMLSALGALRAGAGIVSRTIRASWSTVVPLPEAIFEPLSGLGDCYNAGDISQLESVIKRYDTLVVGPGIGVNSDTEEFLVGLIELLRGCSEVNSLGAKRRIILDADALNIIAYEGIDLTGLSAIITPHPGEAARLLGCISDEVQNDRFSSVRRLAERYRVVALLKGAGTLVYGLRGEVENFNERCLTGRGVVVAEGTPYLATPGSGDVLSGVIAGLVAQGVELYSATVLGAWLHANGGVSASARRGGGVILASEIEI
jgi:hydroxyethylthiazole kinase-like uncharacterized protein yjeF